MQPLNLRLDFKDVDLIYFLVKKSEQIAKYIN